MQRNSKRSMAPPTHIERPVCKSDFMSEINDSSAPKKAFKGARTKRNGAHTEDRRAQAGGNQLKGEICSSEWEEPAILSTGWKRLGLRVAVRWRGCGLRRRIVQPLAPMKFGQITPQRLVLGPM